MDIALKGNSFIDIPINQMNDINGGSKLDDFYRNVIVGATTVIGATVGGIPGAIAGVVVGSFLAW